MNMNRTSVTTRSFTFAARLCAAVAVLPLTVGCLSDEEKEARRAWAYDLSGDYTEVRDEGVRAGAVVIENETSKNDIKVTFTRGDLYEGEQAYVDLIKDEAARAEVVETLVIGAGESELTESLVGGENISDNFGESSRFAISSSSFEATPKIDEATDAKVYWNLSAEILNNSDELKGTLVVHYSDRRPSSDPEAEEDARELHTESESFTVLFKRDEGPIEGEVCDDCKSGPSGDDEESDPADGSDEDDEESGES